MGGIDDLQKAGTIMSSLMENARLHHTAASYIQTKYSILIEFCKERHPDFLELSLCFLSVMTDLFQSSNGDHLVEPSFETWRGWRLPVYQYTFFAATIPALRICLWWEGRALVSSEQPNIAKQQSGCITSPSCLENQLNIFTQKLVITGHCQK